MNTTWLHSGVTGLLLFVSSITVQAAPTIYSWSRACAGGINPSCSDDYRYGDPATSSVSRPEILVLPTGGYSYSAEASASALGNRFSLFAHAGGGTFGPDTANAGGVGQYGMTANAQVQYHDEVLIPGFGVGTLIVPWHIVGAFDISATSGDPYAPGASFGVSFCQSIPGGSGVGGVACGGGGTENFHSSTAYDDTLLLAYKVERGMSYALNTTFNLGVASGAGLAAAASADFLHTGLMQAASFYDANSVLVPDVVIIAASGINYLDPQAPSTVPLPPSLALFAPALVGLGRWRRRQA